MRENCSNLCSSILTFVSHYPVLQSVCFFLFCFVLGSFFCAGRHFFIRKMKIKMPNRKKHVLSKVGKNIIFHNKTLLVMFYRHKTFWYQFYNFKHFLKAENSEGSLASSCEEFCISFRVTQYENGLLNTHKHTLTSTGMYTSYSGPKTEEKYLYLPTTEFSDIFKSGTKEVQYIFGSVNYHRHKFWRLKMGWNLTTIDLMSTTPSILVYVHCEFSIHTSLTLSFKWLVQIKSHFTLARFSQIIQ